MRSGSYIKVPSRVGKREFQHYGSQQRKSGFSWVVIISWFLIVIWASSMVVAWKLGLISFSAINFSFFAPSEELSSVSSDQNVLLYNPTALRGSPLVEPVKPDISSSQSIDNSNSVSSSSSLVASSPTKGEFDVHVIFSTDCTPYQDWQSIVLFYSAIAVNQPGPITRIVSGCKEDQKTALIELYNRLFPNHQYRAHFTPDFKKDEKTGKSYDFYNKPWGLKHWLENAEVPLAEDTVVALIDPDMIFIRPLTSKVRGVENNLFDRSYLNARTLPVKVEKGVAVGQMYGLGAPWTNDNHKKFNRKFICGENSPCLKSDLIYGERHFSVGPPYVLAKPDLQRIAQTWTNFVPRVYQGYPYLLAEMYAYSMAAAHEELPHLQLENHMISNTESPGEGWPWIDALKDEELCTDPDADTGLYLPNRPLPTLMHYCQTFGVKDINFGKRRVVNAKIFNCDSPLFVEPTIEYAKYTYAEGQYKKRDDIQRKRHSFSVCLIHRSINKAIIAYKKEMCGADANFEKTLNLYKPASN